MAETEASERAPTELLSRLRRLHERREKVLVEIAALPPGRVLSDDELAGILFELAVHRGLSHRELGELLGCSHELVGMRIRPVRVRLGIHMARQSRLTLEQRHILAEVPRPWKDHAETLLLDMARSGLHDGRRELGRRARALLAEMEDVAGRLRDEGWTDDQIAEAL